ncbi:hypothetical protein KFK09_020521 [Dendrobium nobile]|uniref:Uncharacterized protein n=1 Tax=Dendrobium nobile TaxID=94219 RepID=A0A8T3AMR1_DENNO|nr:hypothetical protein KFK09_020521 [Dendrobium nobile]
MSRKDFAVLKEPNEIQAKTKATCKKRNLGKASISTAQSGKHININPKINQLNGHRQIALITPQICIK